MAPLQKPGGPILTRFWCCCCVVDDFPKYLCDIAPREFRACYKDREGSITFSSSPCWRLRPLSLHSCPDFRELAPKTHRQAQLFPLAHVNSGEVMAIGRKRVQNRRSPLSLRSGAKHSQETLPDTEKWRRRRDRGGSHRRPPKCFRQLLVVSRIRENCFSGFFR